VVDAGELSVIEPPEEKGQDDETAIGGGKDPEHPRRPGILSRGPGTHEVGTDHYIHDAIAQKPACDDRKGREEYKRSGRAGGGRLNRCGFDVGVHASSDSQDNAYSIDLQYKGQK